MLSTFLALFLLLGCTTVPKPNHYRGNKTVILIGRADFRAAAEAAPDFVTYCILTINQLEYEMCLSQAETEQARARKPYVPPPRGKDGRFIKKPVALDPPPVLPLQFPQLNRCPNPP